MRTFAGGKDIANSGRQHKRTMKYDQYRQLRTYSWYDGIYLAVLWTASFGCMTGIPLYEPLAIACNLIALMTPFFVGYRLRKYRDEGLGGEVSFGRGLLYCFRVFFNAAILFAIVQWVYMQFIDNGHLAALLRSFMERPEYQEVLKTSGVASEEIDKAIDSISPAQFAMSYFIINTFVGICLSFIIALIMKKERHAGQH